MYILNHYGINSIISFGFVKQMAHNFLLERNSKLLEHFRTSAGY